MSFAGGGWYRVARLPLRDGYVTESLSGIATSEQDWSLGAQNYAGVQSRGYLPGPLSPVTEGSVPAFHEWYERALGLPGPAERTG